jgi:hypothetical protein
MRVWRSTVDFTGLSGGFEPSLRLDFAGTDAPLRRIPVAARR